MENEDKNSLGGISIFHVMTVQRVMNWVQICLFSHKRKDFHLRGRRLKEIGFFRRIISKQG